jgi:hypothetical protein
MTVNVTAPGGVEHEAVVVSLRHQWDDLETVAAGRLREFGLLLDPPYLGPIPAQVTG